MWARLTRFRRNLWKESTSCTSCAPDSPCLAPQKIFHSNGITFYHCWTFLVSYIQRGWARNHPSKKKHFPEWIVLNGVLCLVYWPDLGKPPSSRVHLNSAAYLQFSYASHSHSFLLACWPKCWCKVQEIKEVYLDVNCECTKRGMVSPVNYGCSKRGLVSPGEGYRCHLKKRVNCVALDNKICQIDGEV